MDISGFHHQESYENLLFVLLCCMLLGYIYLFPWVSLITVSHSTVSDLCSSSMGEFLSGLENSDWLKHIRSILAAGIFVARVRHRTDFEQSTLVSSTSESPVLIEWVCLQAVAEKGISILIHCSDGWDRTAQVCSIASVLLDPYYRTLKGFMVNNSVIYVIYIYNIYIYHKDFPYTVSNQFIEDRAQKPEFTT